jgi:hypothetical protein
MARCAPEQRFHAAALVQRLLATTGIIALNIILPGAAFGQLAPNQWTPAQFFPGEWFANGNWSDRIPTFNSAVTIDAAPSQPVVANTGAPFFGSAQAGQITIGANAQLTIANDGILTVTNDVTVGSMGTVTEEPGGRLTIGLVASPSPGITVNNGSALRGNGTVVTSDVPGTTINAGGSLVPEGPMHVPGTMTVTGNLTFQPGAFYVVQVTPSMASSTNVIGGAELHGGTVVANFGLGTFMNHYTILTARELDGTFAAQVATPGLPPDFGARLNYPGNSVVLNLFAQLVPEPTLPSAPPGPPIPPIPGLPPPPPQLSAADFTVNQLNVGHAIDNFFNNGGALPPAFLSLFNLTGGNLTNALNQLSGEPATGAQKVAFQLTNQFLDLMLDPFVDGRSRVGCTEYPVRALGFAPERETMPPELALAYASVFKEPPISFPSSAG